jgi:hypothetical protein
MCLSPALAHQHQPIVAACLSDPAEHSRKTAAPESRAERSYPQARAPPEHQPNQQDNASRAECGPTATKPAQQVHHQPSQKAGLLCSEALKVAEALMLGMPNTCGPLLQPLQQLISNLLPAATPGSAAHSARQPAQVPPSRGSAQPSSQKQATQDGGTQPVPQSAQKGKHQRPPEHSGSMSKLLSQTPQHSVPRAAGGEYSESRVRVSDSHSYTLLLRAVASFARVVAADKLQLQGNTWQLLARCALTGPAGGPVRAITMRLLHTLMAQSSSSAASASGSNQGGSARRGAAVAAAGGHAGRDQDTSKAGRGVPGRAGVAKGGTMGVSGGGTTGCEVPLALFTNCPPALRLQLVEEVLLGPEGLLGPVELGSDGLVLPVLQALAAAEGAGDRAAALALLARMTPSPRALAAVGQYLQVRSRAGWSCVGYRGHGLRLKCWGGKWYLNPGHWMSVRQS